MRRVILGIGLAWVLASNMAPGLAQVGPPDTADWVAAARDLERRSDWRGLLDLGRAWTQADTDNALAWFTLGRAYRGLERQAEAIEAYQQSLRLDPGDVLARNNLGNAYRDSRRYWEALLAYREAVRTNPDFVPAWQNFGRTYYLLKGDLGVIDTVERVRQVDPALARAWYSLLVAFYRTRNDAAGREALALLRSLRAEEVDKLFAIVLEQVR